MTIKRIRVNLLSWKFANHCIYVEKIGLSYLEYSEISCSQKNFLDEQHKKLWTIYNQIFFVKSFTPLDILVHERGEQ